MTKVRLTADDVEYLRELRHVGAGRIYLESQRRLERLGLITIHDGRFGEYTRLTEAGTNGADAAPATAAVNRSEEQLPASDTGQRGKQSERKAMIRTATRIKKKRR